MNIVIKQITYGSSLYFEALNFRFRILRQPLNLQWSKADLEGEEKFIHIAAFLDEKIVGSVVLKLLTKTRFQLKQMAVDEEIQRSGIGTKIIKFAEDLSRLKGCKKIQMIARVPAMKFYEKLGYKTVGKAFDWELINVIKMFKKIDS